MYKVLVIDDEKWIRKGIIAAIDNKDSEIEEVYEAENAFEALETFESKNPDILICDVKMPVKDGCTFCEEIVQYHPETKIIMVSGYDEFSYAQRALKYKAVDYLLKPLSSIELNKAIQKVINELNSERTLKKLNSNPMANLEKSLMHYLQSPSGFEDDQLKEMLNQNIGGFKDYFLITAEYNKDEYEVLQFKNTLEDIIKKILGEETRFVVFNINPSNICIAVFRKNEAMDKSILARRLIMGLQYRNILQFCIGESRLYEDITDLSQAYNETKNQLDGRKISDSFYCSDNDTNQDKLSDKYSMLAKEILSCMERSNTSRLRDLFEEIHKQFQLDSDMSIKTIRIFFIGLLYDCIEFLMQGNSYEKQLLEDGMERANRIISSYSLEQVVKIAAEFAENVLKGQRKKLTNDIREIVEVVIEYMKANYREEIGLNDIASRYFINSSYFSYMFKEITGQTFINYLTSIRLEEAKKLITETDLKINEIASLVGYSDGHYFCKVFKKVTGIAPTQYKSGSIKDDKSI